MDRVTGYDTVSTALALLSDRQLGDLVERAPLAGSGVGGTSMLLRIEGVRVFAKRIPLTDLERLPEHVMSTANLFGVPTFCQYGIGRVGSPSFGVWRELAAHTMTTNWVLAGRNAGFPMMYHWRVLTEHAPIPMPQEWADVDDVVEYWQGSAAVRDRLDAIRQASASIVLFLEYVPQNLLDWLNAQLAAGPDAVEAACAMVERCLTDDVSYMNANGLLHFDAHFRNILTDGDRLYLADFGLATSPRFDLSAAEIEFLERNATHDAAHTVTQLVNWLVTALDGSPSPAERNARIQRYADGAIPSMPPAAAGVVRRYAPIAAVLNAFYWTLYGESRIAPYPAEEIARVMSTVDLRL